MTVRPSHWERVSGILGLWVGKKGSEIQVADDSGNLYNAGARLVPAETKVEKFVTLPIAFGTTGLATGVTIATLPAGSVITSLACKVDTAWNSGDSAALSIGYGASLNELVNGFNATGTGLATIVTNAIPMVRATETTVKVKVAVAGTAANAGAAHITLGYI